MKLVFLEEDKPFLSDVSYLFYNFELLHDFSLILSAEDYKTYKFSSYFWFRNGRPIRPNDKLRVIKISKESPLTLELLIAGLPVGSGALWIIVQIIEKIQNWKLNGEKLRLEVEKLRLEKTMLQLDLEQKVKQREAYDILQNLIERFEKSSVRLADMEIVIREDKKK